MSFKEFVKDIGLIGFTEVAVAFGGIILLPILTKTLGASGYGLWQQVIVTIALLSPFASFGLNNALLRFLPAKKNISEKRDIFFSIFFFKLFTSLVISSILIIFSDYIAFAFFDGNANIVILLGFIFVITGSNILCQFYFRSLRQVKIYSTFRVLSKYSGVGLAYFLITAGYGIFGALSAILIIDSLFFLISFLLIISQIGLGVPNFTEMKTWLRYGIPLIPTGISSWVISSSDRYVIGYLLGISFVGVYSAGYTIGFFLIMVMEPINFVLVPTLSKLFDEGKIEGVKNYLSFILKYFLFIAIPAVFCFFIFPKQILTIITTPSIAENAWIITPIVAVAALFAGIHSVFDQSLRLTKKTITIGITVTITAVINLSLNILLIPIIGILGAAIATLIAFGFAVVIKIILSVKEIRFKVDYIFLFKSIVASVSMAFVGWIWHPIGLLNLLLCVLVCIFLYLINMFLLHSFSSEEIKFFKNLLKISDTKNN